jgi:serine/threonine protein kinase
MVFETLGASVYDIISGNDYQRFPLDFVRDISRQLLEAMVFLQSMGLIHTGRY